MTEIWSGTIDARVDALSTIDQRFACYVFSASRTSDEPTDDETSLKQRIVIRDRDHLPLPHVGMRVKLALRPSKTTRWQCKTYDVVNLLSFAPLTALGRSVFARALCNPYALCKARAERIEAKAKRDTATERRDVPVNKDAAQYVDALHSLSSAEIDILLRDDHRLRASVFRGIAGFYIYRHVFFARPLTSLIDALRGHPVGVLASSISQCSIDQIETLASLVTSFQPLDALFGAASDASGESYASTPLSEPLALVNRRDNMCGTRVATSHYDPYESIQPIGLVEYQERATLAHRRELSKQLKTLLGDRDADIGNACLAYAEATRPMKYGRTRFSCARTEQLEELRVFISLSPPSARSRVNDVTTPLCLARARQLVASLDWFDAIRCVEVAGGTMFVSPSDLQAVGVTLGESLVVAPAHIQSGAAWRAANTLTIDEMVSADQVDVRIAASIASTLIVADAHTLTDLQMARLLGAYRQMRREASRYATGPHVTRLVLIGDPLQRPRGWCAGSPFADIVESRRYAVMTSDSIDLRNVNTLATLATVAHHDTTNAELLVDALLAVRKSALVDYAEALRSGRQFILWLPTPKAASEVFTLLTESVRTEKKRRLSGDDKTPDSRDAMCLEALQKLAQYPSLMTNSVFTLAPYVSYDSECVAVKSFYQLVVSPSRDESIDIKRHCQPAVPSFGLISLDCDELLLNVKTSRVDHRMCCNTNSPYLLRVACHRRQIGAASFMLGRDATYCSVLAQSVAIAIGSETRGVPRWQQPGWHESALALTKISTATDVVLLAHDKYGDNDAIGVRLTRMFTYMRRKAPTALDYALTEKNALDEIELLSE